jgi:hypothetical protein
MDGSAVKVLLQMVVRFAFCSLALASRSSGSP